MDVLEMPVWLRRTLFWRKRSLIDRVGGASTVIGCVLLTPGIGELAEEGSKIAKTSVKAIEFRQCL
jgi:hypothetical protein